jgi:PAS domain S-box-containing protein
VQEVAIGQERVRRAADLGLEALAAVAERSSEAMTVITPDRRYVYANPAACAILGYTLDELQELGDFLAVIPPRAHEEVLQHFAEALEGTQGMWSTTIVRRDGTERQIRWSSLSFRVNGRRYGGSIFHDITPVREARRRAAALAQTAAQLAGRRPLSAILQEIARCAVDETRAVGCQIGTTDARGAIVAGGGYGLRDVRWVSAAATTLGIEDLPEGDVVLSGRVVVVSDPRRGGGGDANGWRTAVYLPLSWGEEVIGVVAVYLPAHFSGPDEEELAFYAGLADQASVAVAHDRLVSEARETSALRERGRLARELHDSVSQALFSMTLHARTAQLAMQRERLPADSPLGESVGRLRELTEEALAEMRALIFELRPDALAEEGLAAAVHKQAAAIQARTGLKIEVDAPTERLDVPPDVEEHLYRIALEALNNVVRHAGARRARVLITAGRIAVRDDGVGFEPAASRPGHLGLRTMRDRAHAIGGELRVRSGRGQGTTVTVALAAAPGQREATGSQTG